MSTRASLVSGKVSVWIRVAVILVHLRAKCRISICMGQIIAKGRVMVVSFRRVALRSRKGMCGLWG